jgi:hypothetical protein
MTLDDSDNWVQPGKSVYNNARYRSAESIVVL